MLHHLHEYSYDDEEYELDFERLGMKAPSIHQFHRDRQRYENEKSSTPEYVGGWDFYADWNY